ncbi:MAG: DUF2927 domain-containing protein [Cytophagia bacterium]|nr:DUF2927 domain-containing protein [Cytophagia bacterium]NBW37416.1 DUF2927 domain-containing protein [Cytophagia bacterium]
MRKSTVFFLCVILLWSCSEEEPIAPTPKPPADKLTYTIDYFKAVALGVEFGNASAITRKWNMPMKIFVGGEAQAVLQQELIAIVDELNVLTTDNFAISITQDSLESNCYVFFGSSTSFVKVYPASASNIQSNWGLFYYFWNAQNDVYKSVVFVDTHRTRNDAERKHLLREELTQSLGLARDSELYPESIFQSAWTTTNEYAEIDRDLIRLLYHPTVKSGLTANQVDPILRQAWKDFHPN